MITARRNHSHLLLFVVSSALAILLSLGLSTLSSPQYTAHAAPRLGIAGTWRINANGSLGTLILTSPDNRVLQGTITFPDTGNRTDKVKGIWDNTAGVINFNRFLPNNVTQNYTGFLGDNHPENILLAGLFAQSNGQGPRDRFGWYAIR
jgi:hypothetical protein